MTKLENDQVDLNGQALSLENIRQLVATIDTKGFASITTENEAEAVALLHAGILDQGIRGGLRPGPDYQQFREELAVIY